MNMSRQSICNTIVLLAALWYSYAKHLIRWCVIAEIKYFVHSAVDIIYCSIAIILSVYDSE